MLLPSEGGSKTDYILTRRLIHPTGLLSTALFLRLTEVDEALAELVDAAEAAFLRVGRPLDGDERHEQLVAGRVLDQVPLGAAERADQGRRPVRAVVDPHKVKRAAAGRRRLSLSERETVNWMT